MGVKENRNNAVHSLQTWADMCPALSGSCTSEIGSMNKKFV
jgi:hypothetical protein